MLSTRDPAECRQANAFILRLLRLSAPLLQQIEAQAAAAGGKRPPIISFSHFLPLQALLPEKRML